MRRKVIQLAGKTSVISLPSGWIRKYSIKKSDELDIEERGNELIIRTDYPNKRTSVKLDVGSFSERTLRYCVSALHKSGYDEISLHNVKPQFSSVINDLVSCMLLGFVVSENTEKRIVIKNMAAEDRNEFDSALRRCFLVTLSLADKSLDVLKGRDVSSSDIIGLEKNNNQLCSFCLRLINKGISSNESNHNFLSIVIWTLEKIADEYKYISGILNDSKVMINNDTLKLCSATNDFLKDYYNLFYNFSPAALNELNDNKAALTRMLNNISFTTREDTQIANHLMTIVSKTSDLSSSIFAINHRKVLNNY